MGRMTLRNLNPVRSFSVKLKFEPPGPCMAAADHGETIAERNADCCHSFPGGMAQLVCRTGLVGVWLTLPMTVCAAAIVCGCVAMLLGHAGGRVSYINRLAVIVLPIGLHI